MTSAKQIIMELPAPPLTPEQVDFSDWLINNTTDEAARSLGQIAGELVVLDVLNPKSGRMEEVELSVAETFARVEVFWDLNTAELLRCMQGLLAVKASKLDEKAKIAQK